MTTSRPGTHSALPDASAPPARPGRSSLDDDEIARALAPEVRHPGTTLDALQQLEDQLVLRDAEAREFEAWEARMQSIGTPEAPTNVNGVPADTGDAIHSSAAVGLLRERTPRSANWAARMLRRILPARSGR